MSATDSSARRRAALRALLIPSSDIYDVADMATAKRLGGILWVVGWAITLVLLPFAPPIHHIGDVGWAVSAGALLGTLVLVRRMLITPERVMPNELLLSSYLALVMITLLEWLGGRGAPYQELFLLTVVYTAAVHPPRRLLPYGFAFVGAVCAPLVYAPSNGTERLLVLTELGLWLAIGGVTVPFISIVRANRLGLLAEERAARAQARVDPLTGLGNRRAFDEALTRAVAGTRRADRPFSIVIADLAGFKRVNDSFGHLEGDRCLQQVADALRNTVRGPDASFRWGGDEFALVLPSTDRASAERVAERVRDAVETAVALPSGAALRVHCGSAQFEDGMDEVGLLQAADRALIDAKADDPVEGAWTG
jgi:diguanylate cyclase (GGDEF)-like protein